MEHRYYYHTNDKNAVFAYAHYSDPAFAGEGACIFGKDEPGVLWDYDDRLWEWNRAKAEHAARRAREELQYAPRTAGFVEAFLSIYYGRPIDLVCIIAGTRPFDGYSWHAYGYRFREGQS